MRERGGGELGRSRSRSRKPRESPCRPGPRSMALDGLVRRGDEGVELGRKARYMTHRGRPLRVASFGALLQWPVGSPPPNRVIILPSFGRRSRGHSGTVVPVQRRAMEGYLFSPIPHRGGAISPLLRLHRRLHRTMARYCTSVCAVRYEGAAVPRMRDELRVEASNMGSICCNVGFLVTCARCV